MPELSAEEAARFLEFGRQFLLSQPFSMLLGAELVALSPGRSELALPVQDKLLQHHGFVHGGAVSYLADNALTYAGGTAMRVPVVTSEFKINYIRPAIGQRLVARAEAVHSGRTQAVCRCEVYSIDGGVEKLCAIAQGTIVVLPAAPTAGPDPTLPAG
jgi:uncharacterized protein (TIGR00369 family)